MQYDQRDPRPATERKSPLRFWNARWVPQRMFLAARRDLSTTPASQLKKVESVDLTLAAAAVAVKA